MKSFTIVVTLLWAFSATVVAQEASLGPRDKALIQGAFDGELAKVQAVLAKGASLEATGPKGRTAVIWAAANGHTSVVEFLHRQGADIKAKDSNDQTALMFAVKGSYAETVKYLLENGADVNARSIKQGFTPLTIAAAVGDVNVVRLLLDHGADKNIAERDGNTALDRARQYGHPEVVALLGGEVEVDSSS